MKLPTHLLKPKVEIKPPKVYVRKNNIIYVSYEIDGKRYQRSSFLKGNKTNMYKVQEVVDDIVNTNYLDLHSISERFKSIDRMRKTSLKMRRIMKEEDIEKIDDITKKLSLFSEVKKLMLEDRSKKKLSINIYDRVLNEFDKMFPKIMMMEITSTEVEKYKDKLSARGLSYDTILTYTKYLHIFINWCIENDYYIYKNPVTKLKEKQKAHIIIISDEHMKQILEKLIETPIYNFIRFLHYTGFRRNEAYNLNWSQIDFKLDIIRVITFKDHEREDVFPLNIANGELREMLKGMYKNKTNDKVFNLMMHEDTMLKIFKRAVKNADIDSIYTLHDIRRTTISNWAKKLHPIQLIKLSRHKSIKTAMKYYINLDMKEIGGLV